MKTLLLTTCACLLVCSVANAQQTEQYETARKSIVIQSPAVQKAAIKQLKLKTDPNNPEEFENEIISNNQKLEKKYIAEENAKLILMGYMKPEENKASKPTVKKEIKSEEVVADKQETTIDKSIKFFSKLRKKFAE